ncbi:hypothetical protein [Aquibium microcysteis]|nr:hypothetical protein [Aquibium microcysteis]
MILQDRRDGQRPHLLVELQFRHALDALFERLLLLCGEFLHELDAVAA